MRKHPVLVLVLTLQLVLQGCGAIRVHHPLSSATFEVRNQSGERTVRAATPEQIAYLDAWLKRSIDLPSQWGKIANADVTAIMIVLLPAPAKPPTPAELYLQVGQQEVVIYRKGEFRFLLSREEMADFRHNLGLPPAWSPVPRQ